MCCAALRELMMPFSNALSRRREQGFQDSNPNLDITASLTPNPDSGLKVINSIYLKLVLFGSGCLVQLKARSKLVLSSDRLKGGSLSSQRKKISLATFRARARRLA